MGNENQLTISKIKGILIDKPKDIIVEIFREFGLLGVVVYVGGILLLYHFPKQTELSRQVLYAAVGIILLILATFISYFRIRAQSDREKALIEMVQHTCDRLAEQLGKNLQEDKIDGIIQKIRQLQSNLLVAIFNNEIEK